MELLGEALGQGYGLVMERAERIDYGIWEESFAVWTDRGRVFAKRFRRKDRKTEVMLRGLQLGESLRLQGFPAPRVMLTLTGDLIAAVDGERYQVTEWVDGCCYHPGELPSRCVAPMGALLGQFHRLAGRQDVAAGPLTSPVVAAAECRHLLQQYLPHTEPFARVAQAVLAEQIQLLEALPAGYHERFRLPTHGGPCFNAPWVEQMLFHPDGSVAALIDWTDGAGKVRPWADDLDCCIHLSALEIDAIGAFVAGYQSENPLPEHEWRAVAAQLCYGHLASTNFLSAWLSRPYRRMADWEQTAELWHRLVPARFRQFAAIETAICEAAR